MTTPTQSQAHQTPQDEQGAPLALYAAHNTLQSRVDDLARHIERVEAAQQERVNTFVSGVLVGAVVVVVIVAVVLGMGQ